MTANTNDTILTLHNQIVKCMKCRLSETRRHAVPGEGSIKASLMFIGEGPGREEDLQGRPFVGRAGKILNELLGEIEIKRSDVFITNIVKCRPSEGGKDRRPSEGEVETCIPYLIQQVEAIHPIIICMLGDTASRYFLKRFHLKSAPMTILHGKYYKIEKYILFFTYHPAAILYNPQLKNVLLDDFKKLKKISSKSLDQEIQKLDNFFI